MKRFTEWMKRRLNSWMEDKIIRWMRGHVEAYHRPSDHLRERLDGIFSLHGLGGITLDEMTVMAREAFGYAPLNPAEADNKSKEGLDDLKWRIVMLEEKLKNHGRIVTEHCYGTPVKMSPDDLQFISAKFIPSKKVKK